MRRPRPLLRSRFATTDGGVSKDRHRDDLGTPLRSAQRTVRSATSFAGIQLSATFTLRPKLGDVFYRSFWGGSGQKGVLCSFFVAEQCLTKGWGWA